MSRYDARLDRVAATYTEHGWPVQRTDWGLAFVTTEFDVLEAPPGIGAALHSEFSTRCPTATVRTYRFGVIPSESMCWHLYLAPGSVDPEAAARVGGVLYSGPDGLVPAPPSRLLDGRRARWIVPPYQVRWRPYQPSTIVDRLGLTKRDPEQ
ncbi:MAG: hypothetical protein ACRCYX_00320 [Dermatophilaceae bacterium]